MPWRRPPPPPVRTVRIHRSDRMLQSPLSSLTSAALVKQPADTPTNEGTAGGTRQWQKEVWDYWDIVGELHAAGSFLGNCMSRIRLTVALPDKDGTPGPAFDEDGVALHRDAELALVYLRELQSPIAGVSQVMRGMEVNHFVAGEFYLVGTEEPSLPRSWEVLSVEELRPKTMKGIGNKTLYERIEAPGASPKDIPAEAVVLRVWQPHPRWSCLADSSVRAVREVLEEIVLLTRDIRGQAMSRLASAGVFVVPSEIDYPDDDAASEETDEGDPFTRDLIRTMATAISDKATAAAVVPFILRSPYDYCDRIRHIEFHRPRDIESSEKRKETIQRFAQGVDLPVEIVLGHMNCVDTETQILTQRGWLCYDEVHVGDKVLTLDHGPRRPTKTGRSSKAERSLDGDGLAHWQEIEAVSVFDAVDEPMLSLEGRSHSSLSTLDHWWPVLSGHGRQNWVQGGDLKTHHRIIPGVPLADRPTEPKWSDDFVELAAWMWTEGHFQTNGGGGYIAQSERAHPQHCAAIRQLLTRMMGPPSQTMYAESRGWGRRVCSFEGCEWPVHNHGLCNAHRYQQRIGIPLRPVRRYRPRPEYPDLRREAWRETSRREGYVQFHLNKMIVDRLREVCPNKTVTHEFLLQLTAAQLELFIARSVDGDGWRSPQLRTLQLHQSDQARAEAFGFACLLAGYAVTYRQGERDSSFGVSQFYQVLTRAAKPMRVGFTMDQNVVCFTGKVWCPTVPSGTWLARRRGSVYFTGNTTLSNAWQIDESLYKAYVEPKALLLTDALTLTYLRPLMPNTPLIVHPDASELVQHPDRSGVAKDAYDRIELSGSSYRDAIGFADSDAPDDEEIAQRIEWARLLKTSEAAPGGAVAPVGPPGQGPVTRGEPGAMAAAGEVAVMRAVQRAGARLRSKANGSGSDLRGVPDVEVAATLGPERCGRLVGDVRDLFKGEFSALRAWTAREYGAEEAARLVAWAEQEAIDRLYAPRLSRD